MKKTANYGLNLWEKTDRIQMEDFNADNAKIEAALAANPFLKLIDTTIDTDCETFDIDLSSIDMSCFAQLILHCEIGGGPFELLANGKTTNYYQNRTAVNALGGGGANGVYTGSMTSITVVGPDSKNILAVSSYAANIYTGDPTSVTCLMADDETLQFFRFVTRDAKTYHLAAGSRIIIYGYKK